MRVKSRMGKFRTGGKTDPPAKGKSIRVVGAAPPLDSSVLPMHLDHYRNLVNDDQYNTLDSIRLQMREPDADYETLQNQFLSNLQEYGLDPNSIRDNTFRQEFERTRAGFEKNFPGGVTYVDAYGPEELKSALANLGENEEVALMDHFSQSRLFGTQVGNSKNINIPLEKSPLSEILKSTVGDRNCYLGICHGEDTANQLAGQGVEANFFARPKELSYSGPNPGNAGRGFQDFFFGTNEYQPVAEPTLGQDYVNINSEIRKDRLKSAGSLAQPAVSLSPEAQQQEDLFNALNQF